MWSRYGWGADDIVRGVRGWNLAAMLVGELVRDPYSHLTASLNGWSFVPDPMDAFYLNWIDAQAQMHHRSGQVHPTPVRRPWEHGGEAERSAPDPDSSDRRKALRDRLGLGSVVDSDDEPDGEPKPEGDD